MTDESARAAGAKPRIVSRLISNVFALEFAGVVDACAYPPYEGEEIATVCHTRITEVCSGIITLSFEWRCRREPRHSVYERRH